MTRRWIELGLLFYAAPLLLAWVVAERVLPTYQIRAVFTFVIIAAIVLLVMTKGVRWRRVLLSNPFASWPGLIGFIAICVGGLTLLTWLVAPGSLFSFPNRAPELWQRVMIFYPLLSVIPQGLIYRVLFFERYGDLFPNIWVAILANAFAFGLGHLFFQNWYAFGLCAIGGVAFAWAYAVKRSFWFANLLHAIGGWTVFTVGLGRYFYHGAI